MEHQVGEEVKTKNPSQNQIREGFYQFIFCN